jgi:hypothetical protein
MKTTILTIALALATMPLTFAQTQTPATPANGAAASKPVAAASAKTAKKHHKKAVKKAAKANAKAAAASTTPAPVKQ